MKARLFSAVVVVILVAVALVIFWPVSPTTHTEDKRIPHKKRILPAFDVVRLSPKETVIAGHAGPGARVTLLHSGAPIGTALADEKGEWVWTSPVALSGGHLSLRALEKGEEVPSLQKLTLPALSPQRAPLHSPPAQCALPGTPQNLTLDFLSYRTSSPGAPGHFVLEGHAPPKHSLIISVNAVEVASLRASAKGHWSAHTSRVLKSKLYTLRLKDTTSGTMLRISLPQRRLTHISPPFMIVRPHNTLWHLALCALGKGLKYKKIYQHNQKKIQNPDLIYPGQTFHIP